MSFWHSLFSDEEMFRIWTAQKNVLWVIAWHIHSLKLPCCAGVIKCPNLVGFIGTSRIIDCRKKNIIFSTTMNVCKFNFRMCFEWNFGLGEFFWFLYYARMCSPTNLIFQTLSPVIIAPVYCGKTLNSVLFLDQCIVWTLAEPKWDWANCKALDWFLL